MSNYYLVKTTIIEATTLTGFTAGIGWVAKKVLEKNFTTDPSGNVMKHVKFTAVIAGNIELIKPFLSMFDVRNALPMC